MSLVGTFPTCRGGLAMSVHRGEEKPLVSGYEGLMTLKVMDAVKLAANSGELVRIER